ncbi:tripartite tricarboxylate transporter TctB family protein [Petroclostridium sp. X23]|uniref:tripartite tricarboxylate transporter TctB family protein n=1 Tax=Petroclostridium sp. X23 TaxID=3045146 RepID=UPI0024AE5F43|nr:tripartite tricarboxylate transporter TctB family protein [Petroclostridium sp. X23]WHH58581.1 tripartite tricarboxylate transporter TctB family protein [Petroclostridium sp. X23]
MKIKSNSNLISGFLFLIISITMYILIPSQIKTYETSAINAQTIPTLLIRGLIICSIILLIQGSFGISNEYVVDMDVFKNKKFKTEMKSLVYIGMLIVYAIILKHIGFIISSLLLSVGILLYYGARKWWYYAIASGNVIIAYYVFKVLLRVNLP